MLRLNGVNIRTDNRGFICVRDLKNASGETEHHKNFSQWKYRAGVQRLLDNIRHQVGFNEIIDDRSPKVVYVHEQVMWAYAAFLSDAFHAQLLATFAAARTGDAEGAIATATQTVMENMADDAVTLNTPTVTDVQQGSRIIIHPTSVPVTIDIVPLY
ncbi:TPA: KilA-N domain-containing protein [Klebsiella aerogenes]|nr:KilA-N domain-containing protein [Klebsiella aerogenes]